MAPRTGRPRTGIKPNFVVRIDPALAQAARQAARDTGKRTGQWIEQAIQEKIERDGLSLSPNRHQNIGSGITNS